MASLPYKIHEWFSMFLQRKKCDKVCAKLQFLCNTEVLIFTIIHYTIAIQASIVTSQIHY